MTQANKTATRTLADLAKSFSSPFLYIGELFADIFAGGKAFSYKVSSDVSPEEVMDLHYAILNQEIFLSSKIQNSFSGREVSISTSSKMNTLLEGTIPEGIDEETGFLLIDTKGGEMNV